VCSKADQPLEKKLINEGEFVEAMRGEPSNRLGKETTVNTWWTTKGDNCGEKNHNTREVYFPKGNAQLKRKRLP